MNVLVSCVPLALGAAGAAGGYHAYKKGYRVQAPVEGRVKVKPPIKRVTPPEESYQPLPQPVQPGAYRSQGNYNPYGVPQN